MHEKLLGLIMSFRRIATSCFQDFFTFSLTGIEDENQ